MTWTVVARASVLAAGSAALLAVSALLHLGSTAVAQSYPDHAITMVVPVSAGGPTDAIARTLAEHMRTSLGQPLSSKTSRERLATLHSAALHARHLTATRL
jgi:hypothetical protein